MQAVNLSIAEEFDLRQLAEEGVVQFWCPSEADRFFKVHEKWPKANVVNDPKDSAMRLAFLSQSIGLTSSYQQLPRVAEATGELWEVVASQGNTEALEELGRISKERNEAYNASRQEDKDCWSDVRDIMDSYFNSCDLVADIAGDLESRTVGEVVEDYLEKAVSEAAEAIVNLIIDA